MTLAERPRAASRSVVREIAARRLAEVRPELDALGTTALARAVAAAPEPRAVVEVLAAPGLHLIAEVKRRSPSAGPIVEADDAVARARAYAAGGAAAISVLCEPHWFGGSIDDLRAVRAAVSVPVLAKEFVVDPRQLDLLRAAGADLVLLLAVLHPARRLARLVARARDLGLEPLVEAHDARELESAVASGARIVGINNRDLRTLDVDPERAVRLRELVPGDRIAVAESGVRDTGTVGRWRATGFDAALVGEALMRSADPAAAARAFVAAGHDPAEPAQLARLPYVKICGVTDEAGILAAVRAGADAVGLNFAPGTPRELRLEEGIALARLVRSAAPFGTRPEVVLVTANLPMDRLAEIVAALDPDVVQLNGDEPPSAVAATGRSTWKALRVARPARARATSWAPRARSSTPARRGSSSTRPAARTPAGPGRGSTSSLPPRSRARCRSRSPAASTRPTSPRRCSRSPRPASTWPPAPRAHAPPASGRARTRSGSPCSRSGPTTPGAIGPNAPFGPTPSTPACSTSTGPGRWGVERDFGGRYVPETLVGALEQLESAYDELRHDPALLGGARRAASAGSRAARPRSTGPTTSPPR